MFERPILPGHVPSSMSRLAWHSHGLASSRSALVHYPLPATHFHGQRLQVDDIYILYISIYLFYSVYKQGTYIMIYLYSLDLIYHYLLPFIVSIDSHSWDFLPLRRRLIELFLCERENLELIGELELFLQRQLVVRCCFSGKNGESPTDIDNIDDIDDIDNIDDTLVAIILIISIFYQFVVIILIIHLLKPQGRCTSQLDFKAGAISKVIIGRSGRLTLQCNFGFCWPLPWWPIAYWSKVITKLTASLNSDNWI